MPKVKIEPPYYPIIYVRGYAGTAKEVEDTVADPYMGFNVGSTKVRQLWTSKVNQYYFESPLVRLMKEYQYEDVYTGGVEMPPEAVIDPKSVFIYRYYDYASADLGQGKRQPIESYAKGLSDLIITVRDRVCQGDPQAIKDFQVYLVAHSMGGLVCRCFLQNKKYGSDEARRSVNKVFTYATPHNGIDVGLIGNLPGFLTYHEADTFNRERMEKYLNLPARRENQGVDDLNGTFDPDRFFCLVGTNERDYEVAGGLSRTAVGPMSDGLVRIENATVSGKWAEGNQIVKKQSPRAFVYRSHSGHYGVVNSEEGYQNLTRFLFGNVRVDCELQVHELPLPTEVQKALDSGKDIRASYHIEVAARVRGAIWDLHRRTVSENSAIFRFYEELIAPKNTDVDGYLPRNPMLFSAFLDTSKRVNLKRKSLGFSIDFGVLVPQYTIHNELWLDNHYEGGYIYRDKLNLEAFPPEKGSNTGQWTLKYGFDSETPNAISRQAEMEQSIDGNWAVYRIPIEKQARPGIKAELVLTVRPWNI